jgi:hypothetical protein
MVNNTLSILYRLPLAQNNRNSSTHSSVVAGKSSKHNINNGYQSSFAYTRAEINAYLHNADLSITAQMRAFSIKWLSKQSTISKESELLHWKTVEP